MNSTNKYDKIIRLRCAATNALAYYSSEWVTAAENFYGPMPLRQTWSKTGSLLQIVEIRERWLNGKARYRTADLLIKVARFVKQERMFAMSKAAYLYKLVQGGQLYWALPFSKASLVESIIGFQ